MCMQVLRLKGCKIIVCIRALWAISMYDLLSERVNLAGCVCVCVDEFYVTFDSLKGLVRR